MKCTSTLVLSREQRKRESASRKFVTNRSSCSTFCRMMTYHCVYFGDITIILSSSFDIWNRGGQSAAICMWLGAELLWTAGCGRHSYRHRKLSQFSQMRCNTCTKQHAIASYKQLLSKCLFHPGPPATRLSRARQPQTHFCRHIICAQSSKDTNQAHQVLYAAKTHLILPVNTLVCHLVLP